MARILKTFNRVLDIIEKTKIGRPIESDNDSETTDEKPRRL